MRLLILLVAASLAKADKLPAGSSYLPPTAASNGYGAPQASYGGANDDYYDDYEEDQQPSYSEDQVGHLAKRVLNQYQNGPIFLKNILSSIFYYGVNAIRSRAFFPRCISSFIRFD